MRFSVIVVLSNAAICSIDVSVPALKKITKSITEIKRKTMNRTRPSICFVFIFRYHTLFHKWK